MRSKSSGFASFGNARLYYEVVGEGPAFAMIHAGVADSRQWNNGLEHDAKQLGKRLPDSPVPAVESLNKLHTPMLVIVGVHDTPYMLAAADYMAEKIPSARKVIIEDAAHLPNMDQPDEFRRAVTAFLDGVPHRGRWVACSEFG